MGFPGDSVVKNLPANAGDVQKIRVLSLVQEDPLEKEMATHSSILAWEIPLTEEPGSYSPWGCRVGQDLVTKQQQLYNKAPSPVSFPKGTYKLLKNR